MTQSTPENDRPDIMNCYETLARASHAMLLAAREGNWTEVTTLEQRCATLIATMKPAHEASALPEAQRRRRFEIMRGVLAEDAQIRAMAQPWLARLETSLTHATAGQLR